MTDLIKYKQTYEEFYQTLPQTLCLLQLFELFGPDLCPYFVPASLRHPQAISSTLNRGELTHHTKIH